MHFTHPKHVVPVGLLILAMFAGLGMVMVSRDLTWDAGNKTTPELPPPFSSGMPLFADQSPVVDQNSLKENVVYLVPREADGPWLILNNTVYAVGYPSTQTFETKLDAHDFSNAAISPLMELPSQAYIIGAVASPAKGKVAFSLALEPMINYLVGQGGVVGYSPTNNILFEYSADGIRVLMTREEMEKKSYVIPVAYSPDAEHLAVFLYSCWWCDVSTHDAAVIPTLPPSQRQTQIKILKAVQAIEWIDGRRYQYKNFVILPDDRCVSKEPAMDSPCFENSENVPWTKAGVLTSSE